MEHRLDHDPGALQKPARLRGLRAKQRLVPTKLDVAQRPSKRAEAEGLHELIATLHVARGRGLARHQRIDIARPERVQREFLGGGAVGFCEQRRHALRAQLVLETVDKILGRKTIRGPTVVAQQIANRVVVLGVRQSSEELIGCRSGRAGREPIAGGGHDRFGERGQVPHPLDQRLLLEGTGLNANASRVTLTIRRFVDQQGSGGIGAIHQSGERDPERFDLVGARVRLGKVQTRRRRHAVISVASAALRGFKDRVQRPRKRDRRRRLPAGAHACGAEGGTYHSDCENERARRSRCAIHRRPGSAGLQACHRPRGSPKGLRYEMISQHAFSAHAAVPD